MLKGKALPVKVYLPVSPQEEIEKEGILSQIKVHMECPELPIIGREKE